MERFITSAITILTILLFGQWLVFAQEASSVPQKDLHFAPPPSPSRDLRLEELIEQALANNPEIFLSAAQIGDAARWLKENIEVTVDYFQDRPLKVSLPNIVEYRIVSTDPGVRGDTVSGGSKPATLESGAVINIPLFVEEGETVRVDTRTGEYLGRA